MKGDWVNAKEMAEAAGCSRRTLQRLRLWLPKDGTKATGSR